MLASVDEADAVLMDRWTILLDAHEAGGAENSLADVEPPRVPVCPGEGVAVAGPLQATLRVHPGAYPRPTTPGVGASTTPSMDREVEAQSSDCQVTGQGCWLQAWPVPRATLPSQEVAVTQQAGPGQKQL